MRLCPSLCSVRRLRVPRLFGKEAREHGERAGGQGSELGVGAEVSARVLCIQKLQRRRLGPGPVLSRDSRADQPLAWTPCAGRADVDGGGPVCSHFQHFMLQASVRISSLSQAYAASTLAPKHLRGVRGSLRCLASDAACLDLDQGM